MPESSINYLSKRLNFELFFGLGSRTQGGGSILYPKIARETNQKKVYLFVARKLTE